MIQCRNRGEFESSQLLGPSTLLAIRRLWTEHPWWLQLINFLNVLRPFLLNFLPISPSFPMCSSLRLLCPKFSEASQSQWVPNWVHPLSPLLKVPINEGTHLWPQPQALRHDLYPSPQLPCNPHHDPTAAGLSVILSFLSWAAQQPPPLQ